MPYFDSRKLARRATNYLLLGISLPTIIDLNGSNSLEFLRTLNPFSRNSRPSSRSTPPDGSPRCHEADSRRCLSVQPPRGTKDAGQVRQQRSGFPRAMTPQIRSQRIQTRPRASRVLQLLSQLAKTIFYQAKSTRFVDAVDTFRAGLLRNVCDAVRCLDRLLYEAYGLVSSPQGLHPSGGRAVHQGRCEGAEDHRSRRGEGV